MSKSKKWKNRGEGFKSGVFLWQSGSKKVFCSTLCLQTGRQWKPRGEGGDEAFFSVATSTPKAQNSHSAFFLT